MRSWIEQLKPIIE